MMVVIRFDIPFDSIDWSIHSIIRFISFIRPISFRLFDILIPFLRWPDLPFYIDDLQCSIIHSFHSLMIRYHSFSIHSILPFCCSIHSMEWSTIRYHSGYLPHSDCISGRNTYLSFDHRPFYHSTTFILFDYHHHRFCSFDTIDYHSTCHSPAFHHSPPFYRSFWDTTTICSILGILPPFWLPPFDSLPFTILGPFWIPMGLTCHSCIPIVGGGDTTIDFLPGGAFYCSGWCISGILEISHICWPTGEAITFYHQFILFGVGLFYTDYSMASNIHPAILVESWNWPFEGLPFYSVNVIDILFDKYHFFDRPRPIRFRFHSIHSIHSNHHSFDFDSFHFDTIHSIHSGIFYILFHF